MLLDLIPPSMSSGGGAELTKNDLSISPKMKKGAKSYADEDVVVVVLLVPLVFGAEGSELDLVESGSIAKLGIGLAFRAKLLQDRLAPGQLGSRSGDGFQRVGIVVRIVGSNRG